MPKLPGGGLGSRRRPFSVQLINTLRLGDFGVAISMSPASIPHTMSTQHPDNVQIPFFSDSEVMAGETEIKEAFYAFSHLGCDEQMWDCEGKEVDGFVVEKLLSRYPEFFRTLPLGRDFRLTLRLPNPAVERNQGKILLEALESIPRHYDIAKAAGIDVPPIFEIILPMTTSASQVRQVSAYYKQYVSGKGSHTLLPGGPTIAEWVGESAPASINVIPLVEDKENLLSAGKLAQELIEKDKPDYLRVFLARSDPALNYGAAAAVLLNKISLQRLQSTAGSTSTPIYPIIGVGSAPFRGNLRPDNVSNCLTEYPSVQTFSVQSSFKYDHAQEPVREAVEQLNAHEQGKALAVDEEKALRLISKLEEEYQKQVLSLQPLISSLAPHVPRRRARRLHVGLFGYSRLMGQMHLPRAITFCAALYSAGIPPELLGLSALNDKEWDDLHSVYVGIDEDLADALKFANPASFSQAGPEVEKQLRAAYSRFSVEPDARHLKMSADILSCVKKNQTAGLVEHIAEAARIRGFLG